jgi:hypothetical protein
MATKEAKEYKTSSGKTLKWSRPLDARASSGVIGKKTIEANFSDDEVADFQSWNPQLDLTHRWNVPRFLYACAKACHDEKLNISFAPYVTPSRARKIALADTTPATTIESESERLVKKAIMEAYAHGATKEQIASKMRAQKYTKAQIAHYLPEVVKAPEVAMTPKFF